MIQKLASLTPEQISALPPADRAALMELVRLSMFCTRASAFTGYIFAETATRTFIKPRVVARKVFAFVRFAGRVTVIYICSFAFSLDAKQAQRI